MTLNELAELAVATGLDLGKNPARTIRYYIAEGLLNPPRIEYDGKIKRATYSLDHLSALKLICKYKKKGYPLNVIREKMKEPPYWTEEALEFMQPFIMANDYPQDDFSRDKPVTRGALAAFLVHFMDAVKNGHKDLDFLERAFVDKDGQPYFEDVKELLYEQN
ncbi:MAG: MerR family transcriptional regulator [Syntrophothermus sp.]|uniref:helix-turn-helix domain-containing protein n=1 Tax=Syntrophothermus sp. TaxID=2736299 RepID=UPI00257BDD44|nr:helix-turn-helix domain-containing protein [Syntrophothermus sp.]NSW84441.1 MerR family transcriptional regulator [Syntrophothermus sp.]